MKRTDKMSKKDMTTKRHKHFLFLTVSVYNTCMLEDNILKPFFLYSLNFSHISLT